MLSDRRDFETLVLLELYEKTQGKGETICAVAVVFCFEPWLCSVSPELLPWHLQTSLWMGVAAVHLESGDESSCVPGVSSCVLLSPAQEAVWISPHKAATAADAQGRGCFNRESFQAGESQSHVVMVTALCHSWQRSQASPCVTISQTFMFFVQNGALRASSSHQLHKVNLTSTRPRSALGWRVEMM